MKKLIDLTGRKVGKLKVISYSGKNHWLCKCDCGNEKLVRGLGLRRKTTQSCGCIRKNPRSTKCWQGVGNMSGTYWRRILTGASKRGLTVEITKEQAWELFEKQKGKCALTGVNLSFAHDYTHNRFEQNASLDRIDSLKGYTIDNVQWIDKEINLMKHARSQEQFIKLCSLVHKHSKSKKRA